MSETNSLRPMRLTNVIDPRLECLEPSQRQMEWGIFKGTEGMNSVAQQANSYSTAGVTWNFNTQSENVVIDRRMYARCQFQMTFIGTAPVGQVLLNDESDAPRCLPLASVTQSLKVTINGSSVESQYADALTGLLRYNLDDQVKEHDLSMSPSCQDKFQRYVDGVGGVRNPLSNYQNSGTPVVGRGAFVVDSIVNPRSVDPAVPITAVVTFTVTEPLLLSPMLYKSGDLRSGLIGVKNMGVSFNFASGQLARVWSRAQQAGGVTITSAVAAIGAGTTVPPSLLVTYLTPPLISQSQIPRQVNYQYYKAETFVNDMNTTLASNVTQRFTNNSIQLSTVPKCIYIWASRANNTKTYETSDTFFALSNLSLNYLNVAGQFSSMTIQDLYQMCVKNGCNLSWPEWSGTTFTIGSSIAGRSLDGMVGSVIKIDVSDLHIPSNVASGMNVNSQLGFSVDVTNINQIDPLQVQLTTVLVYDGLMTISNGSMATQVGVISKSDVTETRADRDNFVDWKSAHSIYGGSLFSTMGHLASLGKRGLDAACKLKESLGGAHGHGAGGSMIDPSSGRGGAMLSRSQLKSRMFD